MRPLILAMAFTGSPSLWRTHRLIGATLISVAPNFLRGPISFALSATSANRWRSSTSKSISRPQAAPGPRSRGK
jgi:hypothetical protein